MSNILKGLLNEANPFYGHNDPDKEYGAPYQHRPMARPQEPEDVPDDMPLDEPVKKPQNKLAKVDYIKTEGEAPNGERYNMIMTINGPSQAVRHELEMFKKHEWGAKDIVDMKAMEAKMPNGPSSYTVYIVDNHKYGMWTPFKGEKPISQPLVFKENNKEADYGSEYQDMVKRVGQKAKEGPRKTVWDPVKRVYKTVPVQQSSIKTGVDEASYNPVTGGDFPTDYTGGEMENGPSAEKWKAMLEYYSNDIRVTRALDDLYRNAQSGSYWDSTVRQDRYLATIEYRSGKTEKKYFKTKREAHEFAKGYNAVVTNIEKIDTQEDTSDLITLPVMLGIGDHKKKWMLQFPDEAYAQKWEFKHKHVAHILWDEGHALHRPEPEDKPEDKPEASKDDEEPGKYGYDTQTGEPLKQGQQSSRPQQGTRPQRPSRPQQYHTSQQLGYTKPSKYNKDDVTDVEVKEQDMDEDWQKVNKRDKTDGMSRKAVKAYRRENPGSKLKTAVTTKPSKLKKGSKSAKRRKSFCARMSGMKKAHASAKTKRNPDSPINKALRRWNCESVEQMQELIMIAEQKIRKLREAANPAQQAAIAVNMKKAGKKPKNLKENSSAILKGINNG
jgi:hypothetical protein